MREQQKSFQVSAEPTDTVLSPLASLPALNSQAHGVWRMQVATLKQKVAESQGFTVETQKLIFSGSLVLVVPSLLRS